MLLIERSCLVDTPAPVRKCKVANLMEGDYFQINQHQRVLRVLGIESNGTVAVVAVAAKKRWVEGCKVIYLGAHAEVIRRDDVRIRPHPTHKADLKGRLDRLPVRTFYKEYITHCPVCDRSLRDGYCWNCRKQRA